MRSHATDTHTSGQSSVIYIYIMTGCWAGSPSPWVTLGAVKKCSSTFSGCNLSGADRRVVLATTVHAHTHRHAHFCITILIKTLKIKDKTLQYKDMQKKSFISPKFV